MATIREKGASAWQVQIRRKGWPKQSATFKTKRTAQAWARKIESNMDQGVFVDQTAARQTTLADLIKIYMENVTEKRVNRESCISETLRLKKFLRVEARLCSHAIINLQPEHFEEYRDRRLKEPVNRSKKSSRNNITIQPGTVKRELNLLKRVIDYRKRKLGLTYNPMNAEDVKRPAVNDERDIRLSLAERERLIAECKKSKNPLLFPVVTMGFETGARRSSLLKLKWTDVDLFRRTALLRGVKNSRSPENILNITIGLTPYAVEILQSLPHTAEHIFPLSPNALRLAFNRARERANVTHFCFHDTRHERISSLFEAGWSMIQIMAQSGHKDPKSVKRYANISGDFLADELAKLGQAKRYR